MQTSMHESTVGWISGKGMDACVGRHWCFQFRTGDSCVCCRTSWSSKDDRPRLRPNDLPFILALEVALSELLRFYNIMKQKQLKSRATLSNPFMGDPR